MDGRIDLFRMQKGGHRGNMRMRIVVSSGMTSDRSGLTEMKMAFVHLLCYLITN